MSLSEVDLTDASRYELFRDDIYLRFSTNDADHELDSFGRRGSWVPRGCKVYYDRHTQEFLKIGDEYYFRQGEGRYLATALQRGLYDCFCPHLTYLIQDANGLLRGYSVRRGRVLTMYEFEMHEVIEPSGWVLLNFLMDARTGLGRFRHFRISNYKLMMELIEHCRTMDIDSIIALPDVQERVELYEAQDELYRIQVKRCTTVHDTLLVLDLRNEETIYSSNRFMIYAMHPGCTISMHVINGFQNQNTVFAVGKSILNRNNHTNIGALMLEYGGGGHENAGTCQIVNDHAEAIKTTLVSRIVEEHQHRQRQSA